jgi:hypothetical protein
LGGDVHAHRRYCHNELARLTGTRLAMMDRAYGRLARDSEAGSSPLNARAAVSSESKEEAR